MRQVGQLPRTNEDIATKFEQEYVRCVRNEEECSVVRFKFRCNILISGKIINEMPGSVASGTPYIKISYRCSCAYNSNNLRSISRPYIHTDD